MSKITNSLTRLQRLEAESIQIMREVVAETENPVMLYSVGKDSTVHAAPGPQSLCSFATAVPVDVYRYALEVSGHV
jgi:hypothetical protein